MIYVCENNLYNEYTHYSETTAGEMAARAEAFGIHTEADRRPGCAAGLCDESNGWSSGRAAGEGPAFLLVQYLPLSRPSRR